MTLPNGLEPIPPPAPIGAVRAVGEHREIDEMRPIYIFDLDGTIALIEHRRHFVEGETKDWTGFFKACVDDVPNWSVIQTFRTLRRCGAELWIWSGRSDEVRDETIEWLERNKVVNGLDRRWWPHSPERFLMRKAGDHRTDDVLKREWLSELEPPEYRRLTAVFEDRDRVVAMWRDAGITCFQVAPGGF